MTPAVRSPGSIRRRVTLRLLLGTLTAAVLTNVGIYLYLDQEVREQYDNALKARARALTALVVARSPDGPLTFPYAGRDQRGFRQRSGKGDYFQVWDADGNSVARSLSLGNSDLPPSPRGREDDDELGSDIYVAPLPDGRPGHFIELRFTPFISDDGFATSERADQISASRPVRLVLAADREEYDETMAVFFRTLVVAAVALSAASTLIVVWFVRVELRPLRRMADEAAGVEVEHLDKHRFAEEGLPDELRPIAQRLNDSLSRLGSAFARERRFTSDAAHELRTPIAEIRSMSEVALRWPPASTDENAANYQHLLASARQMESIVAALLTLARHHGDEGRTRVPGEAIVLADVVAEAWRSHQTAALARGVTMRFDVPAGLLIPADRPILLALLHNLFSNVTAYAPLDTPADCTARDGELSISNGRGDLTADDLAQLSRPFWRKDASRTNRDAHIGLGLTLVMEYATALGVTRDFTLDGDRFVVTLRWPTA